MNAFELFAVLKLNNSDFIKGLTDSKSHADSFGGKMAQVGKAAAAAIAGIATATVAVANEFKKQINATAEYGDQVDKMSQKLGLSAEAYQKWEYVMNLAGTDINSMTVGLKTLTNQVDDAKNGSADAQARFEKLGISMEQLGSMSREEVFEAAIKGFQGMADSTERAALANDLFGKSGQNLTPLFNQTAEATEEQIAAAEKYGMIMSDDAVKASAAFEDSLTTLKMTLQGLRNGEFAKFLPGVTSVMDGLTEIFSGNDPDKGIGLIREGINSFITNLSEMVPRVIDLGKDIVLSLASAITENLPSIVEGGMDAVMEFIGGATDLLPEAINAGVEVIVSFVKGIGEGLPQLIPKVAEAMVTIVQGIADHIPDIVEAANTLVNGFVKGLIKAIPVIVKALPKLVKSLINGLLKSIPQMIDAFIDLMTSFNQALPEIITEIVTVLPELITGIVTALISNTGEIVKGFVKLFASFVTAIPEIIGGIVKHMPEIIGGIVKGLLQGVGQIGQAFVDLFTGGNNAMRQASEAMDKTVASMGKYQEALANIQPQLVDYNHVLSDQGHTMSELDGMISDCENSITGIIQQAVQTQGGLRQEDLNNIQYYMDEMERLENEKLQIYQNQQLSELTKLQLEISTLDAQTAQQRLTNAQQYHDDALKMAEESYTNELTAIETKYQAMGQVGSEAYLKEQEAATTHYNEQKEKIDGILNDTISMVGEKSNEWVAKDATTWAELSSQMSIWNTNTGNEFQNWAINANGWLGNLDGVKTQYLETLGNMDMQGAISFLNMQAQYYSANGTLTEESKAMVLNILGAFDNLPDDLDAAGKDALLGLIGGFKDQIPGLEDTTNMTCNDIVDTIEGNWDINSPSRVFQGIGQNAMQGLINGFNDKQGEATGTAGTLTDLINGVFNKNQPTMSNTGRGMIQNMMAGFKQVQNQFVVINQQLMANIARTLTNGSQNMVGTMRQIFNNARWAMQDAGAYMAYGVANGFTSQYWYVMSQVQWMMQSIVSTVRNAMRIHSPSKVFEGIGKFLSQGLAIGIKEDAVKAVKEAAMMADDVQEAMDGINADTAVQSLTGAFGAVDTGTKTTDAVNNRPIEINVTINAAEGQDEETIADAVIDRLRTLINREVAAYA